MSENFQPTIFQFTTKYLYYIILSCFIIQRGTQVFIKIVNYIMSFNFMELIWSSGYWN